MYFNIKQEIRFLFQKLGLHFILSILHCVKSVRIWSYSGSYFPVFSLNAGKYGVQKLRIRALLTQCRGLPKAATCYSFGKQYFFWEVMC